MKKADRSNGFLKCLVLNLLMHFEWGILAIVLLVLHLWLEIPWFLSQIAFAVWMLIALVLTCLVWWGNSSSGPDKPSPPNKNPYSAKNKDLYRRTESKDDKTTHDG